MACHPNLDLFPARALNKVKEERKKPPLKKLGDLREQCREEVDQLARESVHKRGSLRRRMSKGVSSFRRQIFRSLQNLRQSSRAPEAVEKRRRKKQKAPEPPRFPERRQSAPPAGGSQGEEEERSRSGEIHLRLPTDSPADQREGNEYVEAPRRAPQPAPRRSVQQTAVKTEEESEKESESESEDESEEESEEVSHEEDMEEVKARVASQRYDGQTLTLVQGREGAHGEEESEDEEEQETEKEISEASTLQGNYHKQTKDIQAESNWDSESEHNHSDYAKDDNQIEDIEIEDDVENINLRRPKQGSKIADLTNIIEAQLHGRRSQKPVGGVDPLQAVLEATEEDLSTNTYGTRFSLINRPSCTYLIRIFTPLCQYVGRQRDFPEQAGQCCHTGSLSLQA